MGNFLRSPYPPEMSTGDKIRYGRVIFDNLFNVFLVILTIQIIQAIIIDTFGALRDEHNKISDSIEN